ncbi:MAG: glycoside hydrolase family 3 C-terminal domain-containing protein [Anaerolineales bacterium]|nr:glycoside hydrolase family 3 C-terminal domain-containing protein [Anaerolineales bacterium]
MPADTQPPYRNPHLPIPQRVADLLARMTLAEKVAQLGSLWINDLVDGVTFSPDKARAALPHGIGQAARSAGFANLTPQQVAAVTAAAQAWVAQETRLGIPIMIHDESCSGFMARGADVFPQSIGLASTWAPELAEAETTFIRAQMRAVGSHQGLAPMLDISRDPRWGRLEEGYGEDPYLVAAMGVAYVRGLQGPDLTTGVAATGKHFGAHGLPEAGLNWGPVKVGGRELREVYLHPFEAVVREAGLATIMNAYHELDGIPCGASRELLTDLLRTEWGFDGIVTSDYDTLPRLMDYHLLAHDKREAAKYALEAGLDVELSHADVYAQPLIEAVQSGQVHEAYLDLSVRRVLAMKFRLGLFDNPTGAVGTVAATFSQPAARALAHTLALKSLVLLKNDAQLLPLSPDLPAIAVIGPNAAEIRHMVGDYAYAAVSDNMDGGYKKTEAEYTFKERMPPTVSILDAIRQTVGAGTEVRYVQGCDISAPDRSSFAAAVAAAQGASVAVLVVGGRSGQDINNTGGECRDRATLDLPGVQNELVQAVLATGTPVVLVLVDGRPASIPALVEQSQAVLQAWLPGEEGGLAVAEVLFGRYNPGGKLPVTIARSVGQVPIYYSHKPSAGRSYPYNRYVDESNLPLFAFGHGLSYTQFEYSRLSVSPAEVAPDGEVTVSVSVKNIGDRAGDEVVQLYLHDLVGTVTRPVKELKGFQRVTLEPGQTARVTFTLPVALTAFYDRAMRYIVEPGVFAVLVGSASDDIRRQGQFTLVGAPTLVTRKVFFSRSQTDLV